MPQRENFSTDVRFSNSYRKRSEVAVCPYTHQKFLRDADSLCKKRGGEGVRGGQEHPFQPARAALLQVCSSAGPIIRSVNAEIQVISISSRPPLHDLLLFHGKSYVTAGLVAMSLQYFTTRFPSVGKNSAIAQTKQCLQEIRSRIKTRWRKLSAGRQEQH